MSAPDRPVVILGATGFLGRHLTGSFTARGRGVLSVSTSATGPGTVRLDLNADDDRLAATLASVMPSVVVNAAGRVWRMTEEQMTEANGLMLGRVVAAMRDKCPGARLIQLGTVHEYGSGEPGRATTEDAPTAPITSYGRSKAAGSRIVLDAAADGFDAVVLRLANVCGPGTGTGSLLGSVGHRLASGETVLNLPPLRAYRDFVDIRDVGDAVLAVAGAPADRVAGQIVNIGSGAARPVRAVVDRMVALCGHDVDVRESNAETGRRDTEWQLLDIARAARLLGWRPWRDWDDTLRDQLEAARTPVTSADTEGD